jgi:hypothetical protein
MAADAGVGNGPATSNSTVSAEGDLRAAGFPVLVKALDVVVVEGDLFQAETSSSATQSLLAVVMRPNAAKRHVVSTKGNA